MVDVLSGGGASQVLALQAALHEVELPAAPTDDPAWILVEQGFTLAREHEIESLFAIGNGYIGSRTSLAEGSALSAPATFVAGVFDSDPSSVPPSCPRRTGRVSLSQSTDIRFGSNGAVTSSTDAFLTCDGASSGGSGDTRTKLVGSRNYECCALPR